MSRREVVEINSPADPFSRLTPAYDIQKAATPDRAREPGYYGLPILKRPFWKWEIALYFFFEGISAGSYVVCTMAELAKPGMFLPTIARGRYLSFATMLVCPPLLIADLGRPERFHHMLRIFKRTSPMNHGAWALSGYGMFSILMAALELPFLPLLERWIPHRLAATLGLPFALTMVSYPGVLLSTTSNPVWAQTHFLGTLFASSSISNGAAALALVAARKDKHQFHSALRRVEDLTSAAEAVSLSAYVATAKKATRPLFHGKQSKLFVFGAIVAGLIAPAILRRSKKKVVSSVAAPLLTLAGGLALKWSITYAGQESALDRELAIHNAPSNNGEPFWGPNRPLELQG